jgi:hypothetical protein
VGTVISVYDMAQDFMVGDYAGVVAGGMNVVMGYVMVLGPAGFTVAVIYYTVDATVGVDNIIRNFDGQYISPNRWR